MKWSKSVKVILKIPEFNPPVEEQVFDLVGKVQSNKLKGTTSHISMFMTLVEFALIQDTTHFTQEANPGVVNYLLPTPCTTIQQHTE